MTSSSWPRMFGILLWKNLLLKKRHYIVTAFEISLPLLLFGALVGIRHAMQDMSALATEPESDLRLKMNFFEKSNLMLSPVDWSPGMDRFCQSKYYVPHPNDQFYIVESHPYAKDLQSIMTTAVENYCNNYDNLSNKPAIDFLLASDEQEFVGKFKEYSAQYVMNSYDSYNLTRVLGGMIVEGKDDKDLSYRLRFGYTQSFRTETQTEVDSFVSRYNSFRMNSDQYMDNDELNIQQLIDLIFIQKNKQTLLPITESYNDTKLLWTFSHAQLALPALVQDYLSTVMKFAVPMFTIFAFLFAIPPLLKRVVAEKESGVKEFMRMMGMSSFTHWLGWYMIAFISCFVIVLVATLLLKLEFRYGAIIQRTDGVLVFLTLLFYSMALIMMLFSVSTLFNNANIALTAGIVIHVLSFTIPNNVFSIGTDQFSRDLFIGVPAYAQYLYCLMPNTAIMFALIGLFSLEESGSGMGFDDLFTPLSVHSSLSFGLIWVMFFVDCILYGLVIWYVDNVKPGPYGMAKPLHFFLTRAYWQTGTSKADALSSDTQQQSGAAQPSVWEKEPNLEPGVRVKNLKKVFPTTGGANILAVNEATFSAFPDQIMALLGHNGAGKTTTMSMLTGMFSSSGGEATVNGYDINTDMEKIRGCIGLCPQHNMLFPSLTVKEHLFFFGMLKGASWSRSWAEAETTADEVMLGQKKNAVSTALSGGMKRKLHLGISLMANSKVVLLDEPTSGLDPEARREIWDLLQGFKRNRTVILTTHFMEEADVLGDRIAIMADGKVQCYGSSLFLKRAYGSGYRLVMAKKDNCDVAGIKGLIRKHVSDSRTISNVSGELAMSLASGEENKFSALLREISSQKEALGISSFGLSVTTLEDVFLRVAAIADDEMKNGGDVEANGRRDRLKRMVSVDSQDGSTFADFARTRESGFTQGMALWFLQMKGLIIKRMIQTKRNWLMYSVLSLLPLLMAAAAGISILITYDEIGGEESAPMTLTLKDYQNPKILITPSDTSFMSTLDKYVGKDATLKKVSNITDYIFHEDGDSFLSEYKNNDIFGLDVEEQSAFFDSSEIFLQHNTYFTHSQPMGQNVMSNTLLRLLYPEEKGTITTTYHPMKASLSNFLAFQPTPGFKLYLTPTLYASILPAGIILFIGGFLIFPLRERMTNVKQVQLMAGVHPLTFWLSNLLWDLVLLTAVTALMTGILAAFDNRHLFSSNGAGAVFFLLQALAGVSTILMAYIFSFSTKSAASAFALFETVGMVAGIAIPITVEFWPDVKDTYPVGRLLMYLFGIIPFTPQTLTMTALLKTQEDSNICVNNLSKDDVSDYCRGIKDNPKMTLYDIRDPDSYTIFGNIAGCCPDICGTELPIAGILGHFKSIKIHDCYGTLSPFTWDEKLGINIGIMYLLGDILLMTLLLYIVEVGLIKKAFLRVKDAVFGRDKYDGENGAEDNDVIAEQRVAGRMYSGPTTAGDSVLAVKDLRKMFGKFTAVQGLSFTVKAGECFGLLGVNGAGKTTTFRMLTGDELMTTGNANLYGQNLRKDRTKFLQLIGYCPQFDSIIEVLTGRELLNLFARIRGLPESRRPDEVNKWINFVGLQKYADKVCGTYSGGNKRKLNVAQALVGDPPVIFLDEPSTGVDPAARRKLWDAITSIKKNGQSIVLTSHSMEECEALCDRLAIMVNGQFKCFGGPQHLKNKFGQGFTVIIKLAANHTDNADQSGLQQVTQEMMKQFKECSIKDEHQDYIHYHIGDPSTPWHHLFQTVQNLQQLFPFVQDFSISETSLEEVFLMFARNRQGVPAGVPGGVSANGTARVHSTTETAADANGDVTKL